MLFHRNGYGVIFFHLFHHKGDHRNIKFARRGIEMEAKSLLIWKVQIELELV